MKAARIAPVAVLILGGLVASPAVQAQPPGTGPPEEVTLESGRLTLRGFIHKPEGSAPFPVVLWNRGSEHRPGWQPALASVFTVAGHVFFVPHRRGQGRSPGDYIVDLLRREMEQRDPDGWSRRPGAPLPGRSAVS